MRSARATFSIDALVVGRDQQRARQARAPSPGPRPGSSAFPARTAPGRGRMSRRSALSRRLAAARATDARAVPAYSRERAVRIAGLLGLLAGSGSDLRPGSLRREGRRRRRWRRHRCGVSSASIVVAVDVRQVAKRGLVLLVEREHPIERRALRPSAIAGRIRALARLEGAHHLAAGLDLDLADLDLDRGIERIQPHQLLGRLVRLVQGPLRERLLQLAPRPPRSLSSRTSLCTRASVSERPGSIFSASRK